MLTSLLIAVIAAAGQARRGACPFCGAGAGSADGATGGEPRRLLVRRRKGGGIHS